MRPFPLNASRICAQLTTAGAVLGVALLLAGCGDQVRAVITPVGTTGPAAQPAAYAIVVSATTPTSPGVATIIDYSGDSVMAEAPIGPGPILFTLDSVGANGYTLNRDGTITNFPVSTQLQAKNVLYTTVPTSARITNLTAFTAGLWAADLNGNVADSFSGSPQAFKIAIPVASTPIAIVTPPSTSSQRAYAISQQISSLPFTGVECNAPGRTQLTGAVTPIEVSSSSPDTAIPVGICPVFSLETPDTQRLFVLNRGDDTISVINSSINALDSCTPFQNQNGQWVTCHPAIQLPAGSGPVHMEYVVATQQLVVANYEGGTISVIDVPLDQYGNDSNTYTNSNCTTYAACGPITGGFGAIHTIPVGRNPASVTVLYDGSRAYTANQADGTVTVADLSSYTVEKTLTVIGHPRTLASIQNSQYGKVYVASPDSPYLTIIETQNDLIDTTVLLEGTAVDVHINTNNGGSASGVGNPAFVSRTPGFGQPCNLPGAAPTASLSACQAIP